MPVAPVRRRGPFAAAPGQRSAEKVLPEWPVYAFFLGYPVWWVLGVAPFATAIVAAPMLLLLLRRGNIRAPRHFLLWAGFLSFLLASAIMLDNAARLIGFGVRASAYLGATIFFLYVYNARMPIRKIVLAVVGYWLFIVFGGYLGVLFPYGNFSTPFEQVLPASIASNEYVKSLVHPTFAEIQQPYGSPVAFARPSAPLPFTNGWGANFALLLPYVFAAFALLRSHGHRVALGVALAASLVPAFATLNRGLFLAIGVALSYAALRLALRGHGKPLLALLVAVALGGAAAWAGGLVARITQRTTASSTTEDRFALYEETLRRTLQSPILGYGAPRPSETLQVSVGTQGHMWNLMFSYGFPALLLFFGFIWWTVWRTRAGADPVSFWLHVGLLTGGVAVTYYGFDGPQLVILLVTAALSMRLLRPPPRIAGLPVRAGPRLAVRAPVAVPATLPRT